VTQLSQQVETMNEKYKISKQILLETLNVKLEYEWVIQTAMKKSKLSDTMHRIVHESH